MGKVVASLGLLSAFLSACLVNVDYNSATFRCERDQTCPDGLVCRADGFCGAAIDAGMAPDAADLGDLFGPGSWVATPPSPLAPRAWINSLWTGSEFLVFGGALDNNFTSTDTGARFDPATLEWTAMSVTAQTPPARHTTLAVWTGSEALYYGGAEGVVPASGGGRYDPMTDTWSALTDANGPGARIYGSAVWTGDKMLVFGGFDAAGDFSSAGFLYDPAGDAWAPMSMSGAPSGRSFTSLVWTGAVALVWGGCSGALGACTDLRGDGAIYDPADDSWSPMSADGAPGPRSDHSAVWNGEEMLLFGGATAGNTGGLVNTGYMYNPQTDRWRPMSTDGAPSPRGGHAASFVGDKMLVWGSASGNSVGYLYDPRTDVWALMSSIDKPPGRSRFAYAATPEGRLFIWGGRFADDSGGIWTPEPGGN